MVLAVVVMFNALRQPLVIWLTAPLALIGVTIGLLLFRVPFEFMAILGFLSLIGMLVKNSIVLVDEADSEIRAGKEHLKAVTDADVSRARPVFLGALTTILGVAPLLDDPFFRRFFNLPAVPRERAQQSLGSGVIADKNGYVLTNNHVIEKADEIRVTLIATGISFIEYLNISTHLAKNINNANSCGIDPHMLQCQI